MAWLVDPASIAPLVPADDLAALAAAIADADPERIDRAAAAARASAFATDRAAPHMLAYLVQLATTVPSPPGAPSAIEAFAA